MDSKGGGRGRGEGAGQWIAREGRGGGRGGVIKGGEGMKGSKLLSIHQSYCVRSGNYVL